MIEQTLAIIKPDGVARNLIGRQNITVITNSLPVVNALAGVEEIWGLWQIVQGLFWTG